MGSMGYIINTSDNPMTIDKAISRLIWLVGGGIPFAVCGADGLAV